MSNLRMKFGFLQGCLTSGILLASLNLSHAGLPQEFRKVNVPELASRPKVVFVDSGFNFGPPFDDRHLLDLYLPKSGLRTSLLGPHAFGIFWDLADQDDDPSAEQGLNWDHGSIMLQSMENIVRTLDKSEPLVMGNLPVAYMLKRLGEGVSSINELTRRMVVMLETLHPDVINFSGAFNTQDEQAVRELKDYILRHPEVTLVVAAGNQGVDISDNDFRYPWPSKFLSDDGTRPANLVNVTYTISGFEGVLGNWSKEYVDLIVNAKSTSQAAAQVSTMIAYIQSRTANCIEKKGAVAVLQDLTHGRSLKKGTWFGQKIPYLWISDLSEKNLKKVCE